MTRKISVTLVILVVVIAVIVGIFFYKRTVTPQQYSPTHTVADVLMNTNQNFTKAEQYRKEGDYTHALQYYQNALPQSQDQTQAAQIQFDIALTELSQGEYATAISALKQIAANQSAGASIQAHAVEELGVMYGNYFGPGASDIPAETFTGTPYAAFLQNGDIDLAYRHLFEYAISLAPLGYSNTGVALWYADDLVGLQHGATTTPQGIADISAVEESLHAADVYVAQTQSSPTLASLNSATLGREGKIAAMLTSVGVLNTSFPEEYFHRAISFDINAGIPEGSFNVYRFAAYLAAQYGPSRSQDIRGLLAPFAVGTGSMITPSIPVFFQSARTNPILAADRVSLIQLAGIDPDFKEYLLSLGWQASDFAISKT